MQTTNSNHQNLAQSNGTKVMSRHNRVVLQIAILTLVSITAVSVTLALLYDTAFDQERRRLSEIVLSQARLIESVARFDQEFSGSDVKGGSHAATLSQITSAHDNFEGIGETGEFLLAKLEGDSMIFPREHERSGLEHPNLTSMESDIAEMMRRDPSKAMGTIITEDHRGEPVLAAYMPVPILKLGVVAKVDLSEVRAPFIKTGIVVCGGVISLMLLGAFMLFRIGNSMERDIAEGKEKEIILLRSEREQHDIMNAIQVGILLIDPESRRVVKCNAAALAMLEATHDQVIGEIDHSLLCYDIHPSDETQRDVSEKYQETKQREAELVTFAGAKIPIVRTANLITLSGKELLLETYTNISEQKRVELERKELEIEMNQSRKLEAVGSLAAGIAHEINTPIQFVGDNTSFLAGSFDSLIALIEKYGTLWREANVGDNAAKLDSEKTRIEENADLEYLKEEIPTAIKQTMDGVQRVTKIVHAMKGFARPDQGIKSLSNINEMLESTLTVALHEMKYVADVKVEFAQDLPDIECYRDDLNQVFLNLLVNAAHSIEDVIGEGSTDRGVINVSTMQEDGSLVIRIADTGKGIPPSIQKRIFDPFFSTKEVGKGSGQGLSIARKIVVEKHGGSLDFQTEVGKGATFSVSLPIAVSETVEIA